MNSNLTTQARQRPLRSFFDEMFQDMFSPLVGATVAARNALPAMNVAETNDAFTLSFELPGVAEKDIHVQVDGNQLVVSAERRFEEEKTVGAEYHRVEHHYGSFARSLTLPKDVRTDAIEAKARNGILTVTLPKTEPSRARKIDVKAE
ncbi:MAG: Hsp20/alpha crystallin family protein [Planctomycetota bacterium]